MPIPLTITYDFQMYAGEEPRKMTRTIHVNCWDDYQTVKNYVGEAGGIAKEYKELQLKYWGLLDEKKQWETKLNQERQVRVQAENEAKKARKDWWINSDYGVELDKRNDEIYAILTKWKASNLTDLSEGIQAIVNELDTSDTAINNQANEIKALKAKNEKLSENNKKLYSYLGDAWKMISHLQKDLASVKGEKEQLHQDISALQTKVKELNLNETEQQLMVYMKWKHWKDEDLETIKQELTDGKTPFKPEGWNWNQLRGDFIEIRSKLLELVDDLIEKYQNKQHIQKELNDALAILNKPTQEMGTQTDLTAEQISQMEKDLEKLKEQVGKEYETINSLNQQLSNLQTEQTQKEQNITELQEKVKDLTPNEQEKQLLILCNLLNHLPSHHENTKKQLQNLKDLREVYSSMRDKLIGLVDLLIQKREIEKQNEQRNKELTTKNQQLTQLQTKYDLEVRTKSELISFLNAYRQSPFLPFFVHLTAHELENAEFNKKFVEQHTYSRPVHLFRFGYISAPYTPGDWTKRDFIVDFTKISTSSLNYYPSSIAIWDEINQSDKGYHNMYWFNKYYNKVSIKWPYNLISHSAYKFDKNNVYVFPSPSLGGLQLLSFGGKKVDTSMNVVVDFSQSSTGLAYFNIIW